MSKILPLLILLTLCSLSFSLISRELYDEIKSKAEFEVMDYDEHVKLFEGIDRNNWNGENRLFSPDVLSQLEEEGQKSFLSFEPHMKVGLPAEFDWRKANPGCISPIKDQKFCGSCYSFSVTGALETRMCLASQGRVRAELSQQDIISCDSNNLKCQGDRLDNTWKYLENVGTTSLYCKPYQSMNGSVPPCSNRCVNSTVSFFRYRARPGTWKVLNNVDQIKYEILNNGPMSAGMATFEDFETYKGDIFIHTAGKQTDHHAVSIFGWGYSAKYRSEYWILRNSWGPTWGEQGYFKILFGMYEVDSMVNASLPLV